MKIKNDFVVTSLAFLCLGETLLHDFNQIQSCITIFEWDTLYCRILDKYRVELLYLTSNLNHK